MSAHDQQQHQQQPQQQDEQLAYLNDLPQGEGLVGDHDTGVALNNLFSGDDLAHPFELGDVDSKGQYDTGLDQRPSDLRLGGSDVPLHAEGVADASPHPEGGVGVDSNAETPSKPSGKGKGTSRANMLTRGGACEFCKRRKLKCSADMPACVACQRSGRECVYAQKKQRSRVRVLEDRLAELEKKLGGGSGDMETGTDESPATLSTGPSGISPVANGIGGTGPTSTADDSSSNLRIGSTGDQGSTYTSSMYGPMDTSSLDPLLSNPFGIPSSSTAAGQSHNGSGSIPGTQADSSGFPYSDLGLNPALDLGFTLDILGKDMEEPDLMTLADAATHDRIEAGGKYPWDGMDAESIAREILRAAEGGKGIGEKIVAFLLQAYINPRLPCNLSFVDPLALLARLSPRTTSPLHPSLILSTVYLVLSFLPPSAFSSSTAPAIICSALLAPARKYSAQAYATADPRLLDVVSGSAMRAAAFYHSGRFLDGWAEASGSAAFAWACGLGKLGGVGQRFLSPNQRTQEWVEQSQREEKLRRWRYKGTVAEPPKSAKEFGGRVKLFWDIYMLDRCASIGWSWPSTFDDDEITTPWPLESYEDVASLRYSSTIREFLDMQVPSGEDDTVYCSVVKSTTLLFRATRLFDRPVHSASHAETARLIRATQLYMTGMKPVHRRPSAEWGIQQGPANQNWMTLHVALALLYAKEEADAAPGAEAAPLGRCISSLQKVSDCLDLAREMGDFALEGYDIGCATVLFCAGRTAFKVSERLNEPILALRQGGEQLPPAHEVRATVDKMLEALRIMGKRMRYAAVCGQILENVMLGSEDKVGEWKRPDFVIP